MSWPNLEAALKTLGYEHISPESLTDLQPVIGEQSNETRREYREFMWDMWRMMRDPNETVEQQYWHYICYVRDKMSDLIAAGDDLAAITHIALDVQKRSREVG